MNNDIDVNMKKTTKKTLLSQLYTKTFLQNPTKQVEVRLRDCFQLKH